LENRLLDRNSMVEITSNRRSLLEDERASQHFEGRLEARSNDRVHVSYTLVESLPLEPHKHYALEMRFNQRDLAGSLLLGGGTFLRDYLLPDSAANATLPLPPTSFGITPSSIPVISLHTNAPGARQVMINFTANPPLASHPVEFGSYVLREYEPARLPVFVTQWTPYRAVVVSPQAAWLETPRLFLEGYAAAVESRPVEVRRSPGGLVMIPVPAGASTVKLTYPGPAPLQVAYWFNLAAWFALAGWLGWVGLRRLISPVAAR
jgi:hypothetical protein